MREFYTGRDNGDRGDNGGKHTAEMTEITEDTLLLESAHLACLVFELHRMGLTVKQKQAVPVVYEGVKLDCEAQVITYLKLTGYPAALLINFNVKVLKAGLRRLLNPCPAARFPPGD